MPASLAASSPLVHDHRGSTFPTTNPQESSLADDCEQCVVSCQDPGCSSELTQQCTDDCFIVPCDDPNHSGFCVDDDCSALCETNEDCSFHHRPIDGHQQHHVQHATLAQRSFHNYPWDIISDQSFALPSSSHHGANQNPSAFSRIMDDSSAYSLLPSGSSSSSSLYTPPLHPPPSHSGLQSQLQQSYRCKWNDCHMSFFSLQDLTNHVNAQHLRTSFSEPSSHQSSNPNPFGFTPAFSTSLQPQSGTLACQWNDCPGFTAPTPAEDGDIPDSAAVYNAAEVIAHHVQNDHLGVEHASAMQALNYLMSIPHVCPLSRFSKPVLSQEQEQSEQTPQPVHHQTEAPQPQHQALSPSPSSPSLSRLGLDNDHEAECDECTTGAHRCHWKNCTETYPTVDALTEHITAAHVGGGKAHYDCFWNDCPRNGEKGFSSKQKICRHIQTHTGHRPFLCNICKQSFSEAATLQQHMRRHTQEKPYVCDFPGCSKAFAIAGALTIHKRTHNGLKPFKCTYCDRAFSESSNLSKHLRTHTGVRPYSCSEPGCSKSFSRPDQLARHTKVHRKKAETEGKAQA